MNYSKAEFKAAYGTFSQIPPSELPEIAFSGRSNVGKSSLINKLMGRKSLARVSAVPGKTITINFYSLEKFHIVDLPGYGYAKVAKNEKLRWAELIEGYLNDDRNLALVVQLIDWFTTTSISTSQQTNTTSRSDTNKLSVKQAVFLHTFLCVIIKRLEEFRISCLIVVVFTKRIEVILTQES